MKGTNAQNELNTEPQLMYLKTNHFGISINSFGLGGINYRNGWHKTGKAQSFFETELIRVKDPKEIRRTGFSDNPVKYTYGRKNMVFFWRSSLGQTKAITERNYKNALGINFIYAAGLNIGILKPVYIDVYYPSEGGFSGYLVSERYDENKHKDIFRIYGNSNFFTGIAQTNIVLGGFGKAGISVDWGQFNDDYKSLEAGLTFDVFNKGLPMMAYLPDKQLFFGVYLSMNWGFRK